MWQEILNAIPVVVSSMLKFILGPIIGNAERLHLITTILATILGMMTAVVAFTYFGDWIRTRVIDRFWPHRKKLKVQNPKLAEFWKKFGLAGIACFTPIILTPIGGTLLAVSGGNPKRKIILYMLISASVWSVIFTLGIHFLGKEILQWFPAWTK